MALVPTWLTVNSNMTQVIHIYRYLKKKKYKNKNRSYYKTVADDPLYVPSRTTQILTVKHDKKKKKTTELGQSCSSFSGF